ncbi:hypothetical protein B296_00045274 [Ensete ventricosum]|uniref:Uncharacterized protein n=1 Tax=Ensete ventricosum TaxID=4639 RepID=A0A426X1H3_ENSVE|nr:hypothetical protein B296_00045274 [Ensete ventricosum]
MIRLPTAIELLECKKFCLKRAKRLPNLESPNLESPTWSKSLIDLVASGIVPSSPSPLPATPLSRKETTIPFGLVCLAEQLVPYSVPANALARLRIFANTVPTALFKIRMEKMKEVKHPPL